MQALLASEVGITLAVYFCLMAVVLCLTGFTKVLEPLWRIFNYSSFRLMALVLLLSVAGAVTLFYNDWLAYAIVPIVLLTSIILPMVVQRKQGNESKVRVSSTILMILLLGFIVAPMGFVLREFDLLSQGFSVAATVSIALFWVLGFLMVMFFKEFREDLQPFARSRSLLMLLAISFYILFFSLKDYGTLVVSLMSFFTLLVWAIKGNHEKFLSVDINALRKTPFETAIIVTSIVFTITLNLIISISKETQAHNKNVYIFNLVVFGLAVLLLSTITLIPLMKHWNVENRLLGNSTETLRDTDNRTVGKKN